MNSFSEDAINRLIAYGAANRRFGTAMRKILLESEEFTPEDITDLPGLPGVVPDAYHVDDKNQEVLIFEVEDHCKLSIPKMEKYVSLYFYVDCAHYLMRLFLCNPYSSGWVEIDMWRAWTALLKENGKLPRDWRIILGRKAIPPIREWRETSQAQDLVSSYVDNQPQF